MRLAPAALVLLAAPAVALAAEPSTDGLAGTWVDPDGATFTIEIEDGRAVVADGEFAGEESLDVQRSVWGPSGLEFTVRVPSRDVSVSYKVLGVEGDTLDAVWWNDSGGSGRQALSRVRPAASPEALLGVWQDPAVQSTYWIQTVRGEPVVIGGVDAEGTPKMITERSTEGAVAIWTVHVPTTGFELTYRCEPGASADALACTWKNVAPDGTRREGAQVLSRVK